MERIKRQENRQSSIIAPYFRDLLRTLPGAPRPPGSLKPLVVHRRNPHEKIPSRLSDPRRALRARRPRANAGAAIPAATPAASAPTEPGLHARGSGSAARRDGALADAFPDPYAGAFADALREPRLDRDGLLDPRRRAARRHERDAALSDAADRAGRPCGIRRRFPRAVPGFFRRSRAEEHGPVPLPIRPDRELPEGLERVAGGNSGWRRALRGRLPGRGPLPVPSFTRLTKSSTNNYVVFVEKAEITPEVSS